MMDQNLRQLQISLLIKKNIFYYRGTKVYMGKLKTMATKIFASKRGRRLGICLGSLNIMNELSPQSKE